MRYIAAYLLLQQAGNTSPSAKDIKEVISSVGIDVDDERVNKLLGDLEGKDINDLISEGSSKLSSVPSGGGGGGSSAAAGGAAAPAAAAEEKAEEKKEEAKEESDDDMGFGLFD